MGLRGDAPMTAQARGRAEAPPRQISRFASRRRPARAGCRRAGARTNRPGCVSPCASMSCAVMHAAASAARCPRRCSGREGVGDFADGWIGALTRAQDERAMTPSRSAHRRPSWVISSRSARSRTIRDGGLAQMREGQHREALSGVAGRRDLVGSVDPFMRSTRAMNDSRRCSVSTSAGARRCRPAPTAGA